jgi:hypothetical protein
MGWTALLEPGSDHSSGDVSSEDNLSDDAMFLNPGIGLSPVEAAVVGENEIGEGISNFEVSDAPEVSKPDITKEEFTSPAAESVERVEIDYNSGRIQVFRQNGSRSEFALAAWDVGEKFTLVDSNGLISTSKKRRAPEPEYAAISDTLKSVTQEDQDRAEMDYGLQKPTEMYKEVRKNGTYEVPEGDCIFEGIDSVEGHKILEGDANAARGFFDRLDGIAEFLIEHEEEYNSGSLNPDSLTPHRDGGDYYKFRIPNTGNDVSIVIDKDYKEFEDHIQVYINELADHDNDRMVQY